MTTRNPTTKINDMKKEELEEERKRLCNITVHEHKAPTDESVRLLTEMEEKIRERIIAAFVIEENNITAKAIYLTDQTIEDRMHYVIRFTLNGKEYELKGVLNKFNWRERVHRNAPVPEQIKTHLFDTFSKAITVELLKGFNP